MTIKKVKKLSDKELGTKIALLCGWEKGPKKPVYLGLFGKIPLMSCWHKKSEIDCWQDNHPYYTKDLDAMYEAEESIPNKLFGKYDDVLNILCGDCFPIHATARQRAEAFILVMEGYDG